MNLRVEHYVQLCLGAIVAASQYLQGDPQLATYAHMVGGIAAVVLTSLGLVSGAVGGGSSAPAAK
ncbi:MAG: hypothetical protein KGL39_59150 [Patescibacteria group bacterium]|nr:hypothetical protein [Patescibacteria group bacterium]